MPKMRKYKRIKPKKRKVKNSIYIICVVQWLFTDIISTYIYGSGPSSPNFLVLAFEAYTGVFYSNIG